MYVVHMGFYVIIKILNIGTWRSQAQKLQIQSIVCICHGRKSNLVEFQILPVESPIGVSTNINLVESNRSFYQ